jgi:hypothetical protein
MARKPPKKARSTVTITTVLAPRRVADIAVELASESKRVHLKGADEGVVHFVISNRLIERLELIEFDLAVAKEGRETHAATKLVRYTWTRTKILLIPVSPKRIIAYAAYRMFIESLAAKIRIEDPSSTATITERPRG